MKHSKRFLDEREPPVLKAVTSIIHGGNGAGETKVNLKPLCILDLLLLVFIIYYALKIKWWYGNAKIKLPLEL